MLMMCVSASSQVPTSLSRYSLEFPGCDTQIAHLVEHKASNLRITGSSPTLGIDRPGSAIYPVVKWVCGIYAQGWHHGSPFVHMVVQECTGPVRRGKIV